MKKIIVNADDFGINEIVTSEIERMIKNGYVTSTTIMANGACLNEVKRFALQYPEVSYGVHLCLSEFYSTTRNKGLYRAGLTDENGAFVKKAIFSLKNLSDKDVQDAIKEELRAQIDVVQSLGFPISHADSHHHVHTIYPLRMAFVEVLEEKGIDKIRLGYDYPFHSRIHVKGWYYRERLNRLYKARFRTVDAFYSYTDYMKSGYKRQKEKVVELMCHPGHPSEQYQAEIQIVQRRDTSMLKDIQFVSYFDI